MAKLRLVFLNLAVTVLLLAGLFAVLETYYRIKDWRSVKHTFNYSLWRAGYPEAGTEIYSLKPGVYERKIDGSTERFTVSQEGYRQLNFDPANPVDVVFYGDSFTFGHAVSEGERFTDLVSKKFPGLNIANFAYNGGFTAPHYLMHFRMSTVAPRKVYVFTYLGNDCQSDMEESKILSETEGGYSLRAISPDGLPTGDRNSYPAWIRIPSENSAFFRRAFETLYKSKLGEYVFSAKTRPNRTNLESFDLGNDPQACLSTFRHLASLEKLCKSRNPSCEFENYLIPQDFLVYDDQTQTNHTRLDKDGRRQAYQSQLLVSTVMANCQKRGIECVNLVPTLRNHAERVYLKNDAHWNRKGHAVIAEEVAADLGR